MFTLQSTGIDGLNNFLEGVLVGARKPGKLSYEDHGVELNMKQRAKSTEFEDANLRLQ